MAEIRRQQAIAKQNKWVVFGATTAVGSDACIYIDTLVAILVFNQL